MDVNGEWQPGNSWSFSQILMPVEHKPRTRHRAPHLMLHVHVFGRIFSRAHRVRPVGWYAAVKLGAFGSEWKVQMRGKCRSCRQALRDALAHPRLQEAIDAALHRAYSPWGSECVYKQQDGEWVPWLTLLGIDWQQSCWDWPDGTYERRHWSPGTYPLRKPHVEGSTLRKTMFCLSGGSSETKPDLPCWLPNPHEDP